LETNVIIHPTVLPENSDWPHEPNGNEWWQESVVLGWADPTAEIGGCIRIGHQPNRGFAKCCFGIVSRNGPGYSRNGQDLPWRRTDRLADGFAVDDFVTAKFDGKTSRWTARDEHCEMDIHVEDVHDAFDFLTLTPRTEATQTWFSNHLQGGGTFKGRVRLGKEEFEVAGSTYRDHSWGTRLLHNPKADLYSGWWLGGAFGPNFSFGFQDGRSQSGDNMPCAYLVIDGKTYAAELIDAEVTVALGDAISPKAVKVTVYEPTLGRLTFEATGYGSVVLELEKKHFELSMPCTVRCGDKIGGGSVETILNPRNGSMRPFWIEGAALCNGLNEFRNGKLVQGPFGRTAEI
jgi:hypothetical protein